MPQRYTIRQACLMLGVDRVTLAGPDGWLSRQHITAAKDETDRRKKWLSMDELRAIARTYGRTLKPFAEIASPAERIEHLEARIAALETAISELQTAKPGRYARQARERVIANTPDGQANTVKGVGEPGIPPGSGEARPRRHAARTDTPAKAEGSGELPSDLVTLWSFAEAHGVHVNTARSAMQEGRLTVVHGNWRAHGSRARWALDAAGRARFWEMWHDAARFTPCPDCPHAVPSTPAAE